ncbi:MAG: nucleotidyltransferase [Clostridia bacterium]|nr:nucleotidyltransferase [Clostridia bacterium]
MDNVLAIIGEYNPFHNGHLYHLNEAKKISNASYTIAIISGNFVQRGNVSIIDKWSKAKMALQNGVDLVLELPCIYSISSAENFALGAIKTLNLLKIVDTISFGCELNDITLLKEFAQILTDEPEEFKSLLSHELSKGISFPKARENALLMYLNDLRKYANVLSSPNNILAIEYLKALNTTRSTIDPLAIKRIGPAYNSKLIVDNLASATSIRDLIKHKNYYELDKVMPKASYDILAQSIKRGHSVLGIERFEREILFTLRNMTVAQIANLPDVNEGLENVIKNAANSCNTLSEFMNLAKSKRYTSTRLCRVMLYALLGFTKEDMETSKRIDPYIRVLGLNSKGQKLLSDICRTNKKIQVVTSVKDFTTTCRNKKLLMMLEKDIQATNTYTLGYEYDSYANLDYTTKLITY